MKKFAIITIAAAVSSTVAMASTTCSTTPPSNNFIAGAPSTITGPPDTSDTYAPCTIGVLTFSNISYDLDEGAFTVDPDAVNVIQTIPPGAGTAVSIELNPNLTADSDLELEFQVSGGIEGVELGFNGTGTGFVNEVVCTVFTSTGVCPSGDLLATLNVTSSTTMATPGAGCVGCSSSTTDGIASVTFGSFQSEVWVFKDINSGNAPYSEVLQAFVVPEPMTLSLMGIGLLGLGFAGRNRLRRK